MKIAEQKIRNRIIVTKIQSGESVYEIAEQYHLNARYIQGLYQRLTGEKVSLKKGGYRGWHKDRDIDIYEMRQKGFTLQEIGNKYGLSRERVRQLFDRMERIAET